MGASTTDQYNDWRSAVDARLHKIYCITIDDAGLDEDYLVKNWQSGESAIEFVDWYGNKYDLTPRSDIEWGLLRLNL